MFLAGRGRIIEPIDLRDGAGMDGTDKTGVAMAARLKARAKETGADSRIMLIRFAQERLLARLQEGPDRDRFVLKGGMLFMCRDEGSQRPTEDIDLHDNLGRSLEDMAEAIRTSAAQQVDDGVSYDLSTFKVARIREGTRPGVRVTMDGRVGGSLVHMKLDMCSGDAVTPGPVVRMLPSALPKLFGPVPILSYPWETVLAEKMHAMTAFGIDSTRMKDWYDVATIAQEEFLDGRTASRAIAATFAARATEVDPDPEALSAAFVREKSREFAKWVRNVSAPESRSTLELVVASAREMALPLLDAAARGEELEADWEPGIGWGSSAPTP